jgi:hypothetical protein
MVDVLAYFMIIYFNSDTKLMAIKFKIDYKLIITITKK